MNTERIPENKKLLELSEIQQLFNLIIHFYCSTTAVKNENDH
jgi:hypothetical protein